MARATTRDGANAAGGVGHLGHPDFFSNHPNQCLSIGPYSSLISTSTPAARSSLPSASIVCWVGSRTSSRRLCVRISKCSRDFLSTCGERLTREALDASRQRNRAGHPAAGAPDGVDDFAHRLIEQAVVVRLEAYAYLFVHRPRPSLSAPLPLLPRCQSPVLFSVAYFSIFEDHAGADRAATFADGEAQPSSIATGVISSPRILMLSPGMTISVPSGSVSTPVTSVVRK